MPFAVNVADSLQRAFNDFFAFLPNLIGFLVILAIAFVVAKVVKGLLSKGLEKAGLDSALHKGSAGQAIEKAVPKPSRTIGTVAFWFVFLSGASIALSALKVPLLNDLVAGIGAYVPNLVAALLIFIVAGVVSAAVGGLVARTMGDTPTGKVVGTVVPVLVMSIAGFMILNQLGIAQEIVTITYTALIGSAALAMALAFGLGGRDVAARMMQDAYDSGQRNKGDVKDDFRSGKEQAKQDAQKVKSKAQDRQPVTVGGGDDTAVRVQTTTDATGRFAPGSQR
jgi:small-conductance mechanosensitive channel